MFFVSCKIINLFTNISLQEIIKLVVTVSLEEEPNFKISKDDLKKVVWNCNLQIIF